MDRKKTFENLQIYFTYGTKSTGLDLQYAPTQVKLTTFPSSCFWGNKTETDAIQFQIYSTDHDITHEILFIQSQDVARVIYTLRVFALKSVTEKPWIKMFPLLSTIIYLTYSP